MNVTLPDDPRAYEIAHFTLGGFYVALFLMASAFFVRRVLLMCAGEKRTWWSLTFFLGIALGAALRALFAFFAAVTVIDLALQFSNRSAFFFKVVPAFLFCSSYTVLFVLWLEVYRQAQSSTRAMSGDFRISQLLPYFVVSQVVMYAIVLVLFIVDVALFDTEDNVRVSQPETLVQALLMWYAAVLYIVLSLAFAALAVMIVRFMQRDDQQGTSRPQRQRIIIRLLSLSCIIVVCFILRSVLVVWSIFVPLSLWWYFDLIYFGVLEILPVSLMMFILVRRPRDPYVESKPLLKDARIRPG